LQGIGKTRYRGEKQAFPIKKSDNFLSIGLSEISKVGNNVNLGNPLPNSGIGFRNDVENFRLTQRKITPALFAKERTLYNTFARHREPQSGAAIQTCQNFLIQNTLSVDHFANT
jgi:hypothetical protein